jgi:hypothetical protein
MMMLDIEHMIAGKHYSHRLEGAIPWVHFRLPYASCTEDALFGWQG